MLSRCLQVTRIFPNCENYPSTRSPRLEAAATNRLNSRVKIVFVKSDDLDKIYIDPEVRTLRFCKDLDFSRYA